MEKPIYTAIADSDIDSNEGLLNNEHLPDKPSTRRRTRIITTFNILLALVNCGILVMMYKLNHSRSFEYRDLEVSIAKEAIKFETRYFPHLFNASRASPYVGKPRKELQDSWRKLKKFGDIAIPENVMKDLGRLDEGIRLPDGSGYLGTLNVFHELHCVEQMYEWLYRDIYLPDITPMEYKDQVGHLEHCLEALRESVMCHSDLSIVSMRWGHKQALPLANWTNPHVCKNWDAVQDWAEEHYIKRLREPGWLVHPKFGPAYAERLRIGVAHDS